MQDVSAGCGANPIVTLNQGGLEAEVAFQARVSPISTLNGACRGGLMSKGRASKTHKIQISS